MESEGEEEEFSEPEAPRIRAVSLKSLDQAFKSAAVDIESVSVKKSKFRKIKIGPAAQFLVKNSK